VKWFVEVDIEGFFDNIDHQILMQLLEKKIDDWKFLRVIKKMLEAGYMEDWKFHHTHSGTPQGGISTLPTKLPTFW
jgi:RNA-directed DNA polymerase